MRSRCHHEGYGCRQNRLVAGKTGVSVIIPALNAAPYISQAIESVRSQTHPATEILVVDGGSTDGTREIVNGFGAPVRLLDQREYGRKGIGAGRNMGVAAATADWVAFLDADDWWDSRKLELQFAALSKVPDAILCYTSTWNVEMPADTRNPIPATPAERIWPSLRWLNHVACSQRSGAPPDPDRSGCVRRKPGGLRGLGAVGAAPPAVGLCIGPGASHVLPVFRWRQHQLESG